jgi:predicted MFS family arabinose efflux permease
MAGAALFGRACARVDSERLARAGVAAGVLLTALYLAYLSPASALVLTALTGAAEVFFRLSMMDLAARACPHGAEATGFALFMSVFNLTAWASNAAGGVLYERWSSSAGAHGAMAGLILLSALMTAACWPLTRPPENAA